MIRRAAAGIVAAAAIGLGPLVPAGSAHAAAAPAAKDRAIHLPTEADGFAFAPGSDVLLYADGIELLIPGEIRDTERATIGLGPAGTPVSVTVVQKLVISGLGDFRFKVPGPAMDVEALPESQSQPGLRRGSVLWQGFSPGRKVLAARMHLFAAQEADRLPIAVTLTATVDGRPLTQDRPATGDLVLSLTVVNQTAIPIGVQGADVDPAVAADLLDHIHAELAAGRRPQPGKRGIPAEIPVTSKIQTATPPVEAPIRVRGTIGFPGGTLIPTSVDGGKQQEDSLDTSTIAFQGLLGGGKPDRLRVEIRGQATGFTLPSVTMEAHTDVPSAALVAPPAGRSWAQVVAADPSAHPGRDLLRRAMEALWMVARLRQFDGYLGNPDPTGPLRSTYAFSLTPNVVDAPPPSPVARGPSVIGIVATVLAALSLVSVSALVWVRS